MTTIGPGTINAESIADALQHAAATRANEVATLKAIVGAQATEIDTLKAGRDAWRSSSDAHYDRAKALEQALAAERTAREQLAEVVGQALVACALGPGEKLSNPSGHAIVGAVLELKETVRANQRCADREYKRRQQAERERDTALAALEGANSDCERYGDNWMRVVERALAAETALASARDLLHRCLSGKGEVHGPIRNDINVFLDAHPAPVAASLSEDYAELLAKASDRAKVAPPCAGIQPCSDLLRGRRSPGRGPVA